MTDSLAAGATVRLPLTTREAVRARDAGRSSNFLERLSLPFACRPETAVRRAKKRAGSQSLCRDYCRPRVDPTSLQVIMSREQLHLVDDTLGGAMATWTVKATLQGMYS